MMTFLGRVTIASLVLLPAAQVVAGEVGKAAGPAPAGTARPWTNENSWAALDQAGAPVVQDDEVGGGDKLKITFVGNPDLTGEFRVQGDGSVTLPVLGSFSVSGRTPAEIAEMVATRFIQDARRTGQTNVVVDVVEWRPVFVTGGVSKPGAYAYMPGMTVLHAISQSGGLYRIADGDISTFINVAQNVSRMQDVSEQLKYNLVRVASLTAERAGQSDLKAPDKLLELVGPESGKALLEMEKRALKLRLQTASNEMDVRRRQIDSANQELTNYHSQLQDIQRQLTEKRQQLRELTNAMARGIAKRTDVLSIETYVNTLEEDVRDLTSYSSRAERELAKAEQELADPPLMRQIKIEEELASLRQRIASDQAVFEGARLIVNQLGNEQILQVYNGSEPSKRVFAIMRRVNGKAIFAGAGLETRLQPGDVVIVDGQKAGGGGGTSVFSAAGIQVPKQPALSPVNETSSAR
jgi:protein involved in polysaccharide export with SLBB domain